MSTPFDPVPGFSCEVIREDGHVRIAAVGELDVASAPELAATVGESRRAGFDRIVIDLSRLDFVDSTGLRLLMDLSSAARADAHRLELIPGPPRVQRLFEITGTTDALPFRR